MGEWEREYVRLASQKAVGIPARVIVALSPHPSLWLECQTCEEYMLGNLERQRWECPECGVTEMTDREVADLLICAIDVVESKLEMLGLTRPKERTAEKWLEANRLK